MDDAALLAEARRAWRAKREAERHVARLDSYPRKTPAMRRDRGEHYGNLLAADAELSRILGPQEEPKK